MNEFWVKTGIAGAVLYPLLHGLLFFLSLCGWSNESALYCETVLWASMYLFPINYVSAFLGFIDTNVIRLSSESEVWETLWPILILSSDLIAGFFIGAGIGMIIMKRKNLQSGQKSVE